MIALSDVKNIIFDCDGVIFDSNELKSQAFRLALQQHSVSEDKIVEFLTYHQTFGGISRYVKLKYLLTDILKITFDEAQYNSLLNAYAEKSLQCYMIAELTEGCMELLEIIKKKNINAFVASGSDENELNAVFLERGIYQYFKKIYGSPKTKLNIVQDFILPVTGAEFTTLMGDAPPDLEVAFKTGIKAYGITKYAENKQGLIALAEKYGFLHTETLRGISIT